MSLPSTMRAIYYDQFGMQPVVKSVSLPKIKPQSVLVEVRATGLCRSDWHGWKGHDPDILLPHVPGHEFAGVIVQIGSEVNRWTPGDRVTTPFIQACGHCDYCRSGNQQVCEHQEQAGFTYWGSFAEYVEIKNAETNLVRIPEAMSFDEAAVLGCRFGTAYRAVVNQGGVDREDFLLILGGGGVGLSALLIGKALGARIAVVDVNPESLTTAMDFGAEKVYENLNQSAIHDLVNWSEKGVDVCVDAIGHPALINSGLKTLRRRGRYIQVGLMPDQAGIPEISLGKLLAQELEILGSHGIQSWKYAEMLDFIIEQKLNIKDLIRQHCSLLDAVALLTSMDKNQHFGITVIHPSE
ncbi:MAG: alcohol dehydrogenase catalytic domain-containing protein [Saprospiraceae bacterium]|nr:alcohol dehydrogenase catalytic domain-containing protein [Saprospiraceae bacterium]